MIDICIFDNNIIAMKKKIRIKLVDFHTLNNKQLIEILERKYEIEYSDTPDYLFYGPFGLEHLKYDCIRIFGGSGYVRIR